MAYANCSQTLASLEYKILAIWVDISTFLRVFVSDSDSDK